MKSMKILLAGLLLLAAGVTTAAERPSAYGFTPALPLAQSEVVLERSEPWQRILTLETVHFYLSKDGDVDSVRMAGQQRQRYVDYLRDYLSGFRFAPALRDGEDVASILPVYMLLKTKERYPQLIFPVGFDSARTRHPELFVEALALGGVELPVLESFPRFHATVKVQDSLESVPFTVLAIELDRSGSPVESWIAHEQYGDFGRQVQAASMWAEFSPLRRHGEAVSDTTFLLVSYFPEMTYPSPAYDRATRDSLPFLMQYRFLVLPDTTGVVRPPLPRSLRGDLMRPGKGGMISANKIAVWLSIDTTGRARAIRTDMAGRGQQDFINDFVEGLLFYPAVTSNARPVAFRGLVTLTRGLRGDVRIDYGWLE